MRGHTYANEPVQLRLSGERNSVVHQQPYSLPPTPTVNGGASNPASATNRNPIRANPSGYGFPPSTYGSMRDDNNDAQPFGNYAGQASFFAGNGGQMGNQNTSQMNFSVQELPYQATSMYNTSMNGSMHGGAQQGFSMNMGRSGMFQPSLYQVNQPNNMESSMFVLPDMQGSNANMEDSIMSGTGASYMFPMNPMEHQRMLFLARTNVLPHNKWNYLRGENRGAFVARPFEVPVLTATEDSTVDVPVKTLKFNETSKSSKKSPSPGRKNSSMKKNNSKRGSSRGSFRGNEVSMNYITEVYVATNSFYGHEVSEGFTETNAAGAGRTTSLYNTLSRYDSTASSSYNILNADDRKDSVYHVPAEEKKQKSSTKAVEKVPSKKPAKTSSDTTQKTAKSANTSGKPRPPAKTVPKILLPSFQQKAAPPAPQPDLDITDEAFKAKYPDFDQADTRPLEVRLLDVVKLFPNCKYNTYDNIPWVDSPRA
ncbi:hypothetical protein ADEAN_000102900 [Angomonas deanei]|uniref:Uncharacterized protein n=1 Tax=Angomonas deanei TaxID=59799 RepID=A0A7G2C1T4_9TRYP|nr:hypothetical protein ADEAN_000102900 [Angomonas deanei]